MRLPDAFIAHAGLKDKIAFVGMGQKFKLWDAAAYAAGRGRKRRAPQGEIRSGQGGEPMSGHRP
ncbi:MAG: hypothetical protein WDN08_13760 [Rhizomicrobium sp.]